MTSQLNKLKRLYADLNLYHSDLCNQERRLKNNISRDIWKDAVDGDTEDMQKELTEIHEAEEKIYAQIVEVRTAITASKWSQFARLKTNGKRQAETLKAAIKANPNKETEDLAKITGIKEARVRQLARILADTHQITRIARKRWNGMHYLKYFTYCEVEPYNPSDSEIPF